jgi:alkylation response protein AidB-like acyl-CoA dehydrogenase
MYRDDKLAKIYEGTNQSRRLIIGGTIRNTV